MSVIGSNAAGRMSVIGSITYRKDVSYRKYPTGRRSVKGSNPEGRMSVIDNYVLPLYGGYICYKNKRQQII
jgi:hypothetical protein